MATEFEIQKAVYDKLTPVGTVYDAVPDNASMPYMTIGDTLMEPWDTDDSIGRETYFWVHSWSRYNGMKEVKNLMDQIKAVLHNQPITIPGQVTVLCYLEDSRSMLDPDGRTRHGVQRFRIITQGD